MSRNHPQLYTTAEVAEMFGLSVNRVNVIARTRKIGIKYGGRERLYTAKDIDAMWVRKPGRPAKGDGLTPVVK